MNEYLLIILFNIIIIYISFNFKNNIKYIYLIIFVLLISYILYLKSVLIEGNMQEDIFKSFSEFKSEQHEIDLPLHKIKKVLELMLEKVTGEKSLNKCEGEFQINKLTDKECGVGFNERVYTITKEGEDCLHSELYKEKIPLKLCEYNEKCDIDLDCRTGRCVDNLCDAELDCSKDMLSGCSYDSCLGLNEGLDQSLYYYEKDECKVNPCNENTYGLCEESECNNLSYKYKYNKKLNICEKIVQDKDKQALELDSYVNILKDYEDMGGRDNICTETVGVKSCVVGADLQPRYYCEDGFYNEGSEGVRGTSGKCVICPDGYAGMGGVCNKCEEGQGIANEDRTKCVPSRVVKTSMSWDYGQLGIKIVKT